MPSHHDHANLWQIADLLRGPYRPPQRIMLPMTVLRPFDCILTSDQGRGPAQARPSGRQVPGRRAR